MITDYKVILRDIVELFYHSPFKIFNINSVDGETMVKPFGYFISLGITTSMESLKLIRDFISKSDYGFEARLVEIKSTKSEEYGDFLNTLSDIPEEDIHKYESPIPENYQVLGETETKELMTELQDKITSGDFRVSPLRSRITEVLEKIGDQWEDYGVQIKDGFPGIFHKYVNYKKASDAEYRIGIYATKV